MTDNYNQYNETSDTVTRQAVKQQPTAWQAPSMPESRPYTAPAAAPRRRRGDKYQHQEEESAPSQPVYMPVQPRTAEIREDSQPQVTPAPQYRAAYPEQPIPPRSRPVPYEEEDEDDYEEIRIWPRVLLAVVLIALALCVALYFVPNAGPLQPVKEAITGLVDQVIGKGAANLEQPEVLSFSGQSTSTTVGSPTLFHITTNQAATQLRLEKADGQVLDAQITLIKEETNKTWEAYITFIESYTGTLHVSLFNGEGWVRSDKLVSLRVNEPVQPAITPTLQPTATPAPATTAPATQVPATQVPATDVPATRVPATNVPVSPAPATNVPATQAPAPAAVVPPTWAPAITSQPTQAPTQEPTAEPTQAPTPEPTQVPTPVPTATPVPVPTASPMPRLHAGGDVALTLTDTVFIGAKAQEDFQRKKGYVAPNPDEYVASTAAGVLTFRGDNFRRNAAYGTAEIEEEKMTVLWQSPVGSLRTDDYGTLWGMGWTGQPAIVKWSKQVREMMNIYDEQKAVSALREVIFGAQDGKIYFLNLLTGEATRDPINVGFPLKGSVAVETRGYPMLTVGQAISKLAGGKSGKIGMHAFNLISGKSFFLLNGRANDNQKQYWSNGAFDGTALFLHTSDAVVVAGENGLLYTIDLNSVFTFPDDNNPDEKGSLTIKEDITYLRTKAKENTKDNQVAVESSVAMYDKYIYMADTYGTLRCVDSDTMETVWAMDTGDNTDAAIALDMDGADGVSLYTGNTNYTRLAKKKNVSIRRVDALTGETQWTYEIKCDQDSKNQLSGCKASPVIGQNEIADLVIFTVNRVDKGGSRTIALRKADGSVAWTHNMEADSISSPVAVYNEAGDAWIIQADQEGSLYLLDGKTGKVRNTLNLDGEIEGSPAVYKDILVIGTCGKNAQMYGIKLH